MQFPQLAKNAGLMSTRVQFRVGVASSRLPSTGYIRPELMSKAGPEQVEGSSSQAVPAEFRSSRIFEYGRHRGRPYLQEEVL